MAMMRERSYRLFADQSVRSLLVIMNQLYGGAYEHTCERCYYHCFRIIAIYRVSKRGNLPIQIDFRWLLSNLTNVFFPATDLLPTLADD